MPLCPPKKKQLKHKWHIISDRKFTTCRCISGIVKRGTIVIANCYASLLGSIYNETARTYQSESSFNLDTSFQGAFMDGKGCLYIHHPFWGSNSTRTGRCWYTFMIFIHLPCSYKVPGLCTYCWWFRNPQNSSANPLQFAVKRLNPKSNGLLKCK